MLVALRWLMLAFNAVQRYAALSCGCHLPLIFAAKAQFREQYSQVHFPDGSLLLVHVPSAAPDGRVADLAWLLHSAHYARHAARQLRSYQFGFAGRHDDVAIQPT